MATMTQIMQSSALTTHPQSPVTTAAVREHACLFTHDLRRKQKRWQDGRLKYHTFNRRVMVYDERGNFVGDTHWREDYDLADGDDLELERGGIIIQVGECVGSRNQDLSDLIDKRAQERAQRQAAAAARRPPVTTVATLHHIKPQSIPQKHLHDVIGTPSGHHGRAVLPKESPYEERRQRQLPPQSDDTRPAKRQRREVSPPSRVAYAQNLFGATLTLSGRPSNQASAHNRASRQIAFQANDTQPSTKTLASLPNSIRPDPPLYTNPGILDELGTSPTLQKWQPLLMLDRHEDSIGGNSVLDSQSRNQKSCKSKKVDKPLHQSDLRIGQSSESPALGDSKKIRDKKRPNNGNGCAREPNNRDLNLIDLTEDRAEAPKQSIQDEPRTELRIKPRKKRGLLMISERESLRDSLSISELTNRSPSDHQCPSSAKAQPPISGDKSRKKATSTNPQHNSTKSLQKAKKIASQRKEIGGENDNQEGGNGRHQSSRIASTRHIGDKDLDEMPGFDQLDSDSWKGTRSSSVTKRDDTSTAETSAVASGRSLRSAKRASIDDTASSNGADQNQGRLCLARRKDIVVVDEMPAPRLAKLSRKSIKSKEVIGFVFDNDDEPDLTGNFRQDGHVREEPSLNFWPDRDTGEQQHQSSNSKVYDDLMATEGRSDVEPRSSRKRLLVTQGQRNWRPELSDEPSPLIETQEASTTTTTKTTRKQPNPPISNPATRGKKAAKPSDAAGQMPICPLPTESVESSPLHGKHGKRNVQENLAKEPATPMPGFSRANGGPWSREAHDLFDFKRPL
ncbi:hypothetical protein F5Y09DRAFT_188922 [Xylaria sp. FL1042]|nr:hypothetical protein F5Y09DRAFT_188922 [Xylaria sp. FL1042]